MFFSPLRSLVKTGYTSAFIFRLRSLSDLSRKIKMYFGIYLSAKITCKDRIYFGISDLNRKINAEVHPVFTSRKIKDELKAKKPKPPIANQQNVVYFFECDLCDADYVGFTSRHLHQRVEEHKRSVIDNHVREQHGNEPREIAKNFTVLRKCSSKFDCLIFEMFFIRDL